MQCNKIHASTSNIRNICILAHVDHGKTTLADFLVASNGIISKRLAGKLRFLDFRKDEQTRGITMKSSSIALQFNHKGEKHVINVIDSPGHVDFCGEVSTAIRLCDGCLILIDVVEGICSQTKASLKQAWIERLKPILILNKLDRLILEQKLTPFDAYIRLNQILEQANAFMGELFTTDVLKEAETDLKSTDSEFNDNLTYDWSSGIDEKDDSTLYFAPEQGNVIFTSATDGWGFSIFTFSNYLSKKLGINENVLNKTLWGDFYLNSKLKKIMKGAQAKTKKPLFVSMVLENIWSVYENIFVRRDKVMLEKIINSLDLKLTKRDANHNDPKTQLQAIISQWLPLSDSVLTAVCNIVPSPLQLSVERIDRFMQSDAVRFNNDCEQSAKIKEAFTQCSSEASFPTIVCISKMFAMEKKLLPENRPKPLTAEEISLRREQAKLAKANAEKENLSVVSKEPAAEKEIEEEDDDEDVFLAFARVFSGTVRKGDKLYVLGPKHNPNTVTADTKIDATKTVLDLKADEHVTIATIGNVYTLMGRDLELCEEVKAGCILAIAGLQDHVIKSATLSSSLYCPPFIDLHMISQPILRVAVEPQNPSDMVALKKGLKLLNQADPCVEVKIQETGEHVIITTGEVHLERCVEDLQERFAKVPLNISAPIVPFKETVVSPPKVDMVNEKIGDTNAAISEQDSPLNKEVFLMTPNKKSRITMKAIPLPANVTRLLENNEELLKTLTKYRRLRYNRSFVLGEDTIKKLINLKEKLSLMLQTEKEFWEIDMCDKILSFGPKHCGPNIILNLLDNFKRPSLWQFDCEDVVDSFSDYENCLINGFQIATLAGPLCEEPMTGVCFVLKEWTISEHLNASESDPYGPFTGQIMSTVKECCRKAFQAQPQRLVAAMLNNCGNAVELSIAYA
ncbi:elongation factor Tu GTP-binding domain-containing protein 1-like isoform X2 [Leptotrombidium deliense]|uniref:Elongation factor Tu GTP-binding domain-containing protein 1-like isoform X2 n=1 Tax=Leptotrombidium deliense TaxID=299467 RepID=A0A443ST94_9ACAR|nr:elongation factor Tu GTP-binding domain-containing protein 1-like isoform X2 [Leptotrombidium deliense]